MAIKLLTGMATVDESYSPGDVVTMSAEEESRMVANGLAVKVRETKKQTPNDGKN
jgi:hypothetical protein